MLTSSSDGSAPREMPSSSTQYLRTSSVKAASAAAKVDRSLANGSEPRSTPEDPMCWRCPTPRRDRSARRSRGSQRRPSDRKTRRDRPHVLACVAAGVVDREPCGVGPRSAGQLHRQVRGWIDREQIRWQWFAAAWASRARHAQVSSSAECIRRATRRVGAAVAVTGGAGRGLVRDRNRSTTSAASKTR